MTVDDDRDVVFCLDKVLQETGLFEVDGFTSTNWWNWITSIPEENNPVGDETGEKCTIGQKGPVWFLPGTSGGKLERTCTVPAGKALFLYFLMQNVVRQNSPNLIPKKNSANAPEILTKEPHWLLV